MGLVKRLMLWKVIDARLATLQDLRTTWSYLDLMEAISYLNLKSDLEELIDANIERANHNSRLQGRH